MSTNSPMPSAQTPTSDEDFRAKLLGFLPLVTAGSFVTTIISDPGKARALSNLVLPFGLLGAIVTLGLFFYEIEKRSV